MKKIITIATSEIFGRFDENGGFRDNQRAYALANGYDHVTVQTPHWPLLHPSFSKVAAVRNALEEGCEYIIAADADVAFMEHGLDLMRLVSGDDGNFLAAYHQQNWSLEPYLCAGLMVIRNTPEAHRFVIANWFQRIENGYIVDKPWEQWYFHDLIQEKNYRGIRKCNAQEIGCFCPELWDDGVKWEPGMPTIHMAGAHPFEKRAHVYKTIYEPQVRWNR